MKTINKFLATGFTGLLLAGSAQAITLGLPTPNPMSTGAAHNDFYVYPLELIKDCAAAGDARCSYTGSLPVDSSTGLWNPLLQIYEAGGGNDNYSLSGPLTGSLATVGVDNPFRPPSGDTTDFFMTSSNEPGEAPHTGNASAEFAADLMGRWDAELSSVVNYLTDANGKLHDLVFLFDNNEQGSAANALAVWGQVYITDANGNNVMGADNKPICFEISNRSPFSGCSSTGPEPADFVLAASFCVNKITGNADFSYLTQNSCPSATHYWLSNNLGSNAAEFAAFAPGLNAGLRNWANLGYSMSVDLIMLNIGSGAEALAICDQCDIAGTNIPEPASMALVGLSLLGLGAMRRRKQV